MKAPKRVLFLILSSILILSIGVFFAAGCYPLEQTTQAQQDEATTGEKTEGATSAFANWGTWIWLIVLGVAFYFLLIRPQRQRSKKQQELMSTLRRGDEILTVGGFYGRVKDVMEDFLIITIASGVDVKISKSAVSKKIGGLS